MGLEGESILSRQLAPEVAEIHQPDLHKTETAVVAGVGGRSEKQGVTLAGSRPVSMTSFWPCGTRR
jgi:hypothetical protein